MNTYKLLITGLSILISSLLATAQYQEQTFENNDSFQVPGFGPAAPYPSITSVTGMPTNLAYIRVTLNNLSHPWSFTQFDILLEAPNGERVVLISDADPDPDLTGDNLTFNIDADAIVHFVEDEFIQYHPYCLPTNNGAEDDFLTIGIINQENPSFANLQNINPNGAWKLYLLDDNDDFFSSGNLVGWSLTLGASTTTVCERPVGLPTVDMVNRNTSRVSWADNTSTNWDILYLKEDTIPDYSFIPSIENVNGQSVNLTGLDYDTEYAVYLRADCNGDNSNPSRWNGPIVFTTESGICAYAEDISLCSNQLFTPNIYNGGFYDPCDNGNGNTVPQLMYNFTPPNSGDYYFVRTSDNFNNEINSLSIKSQSVIDYCDSLAWNCLAENFTENILLENLDQNLTYKILVHSYNYFDFQISECPQTVDIKLEDFTEHSFDVDFYLTTDDEVPIEGEIDIYYQLANGAEPENDVDPQNTDNITGGLISTLPLDLIDDTAYDLYVRQVCANGVTCWQGPFGFRTSKHCGDINGQDALTIKTTATTAWIQSNDTSLELNQSSIIIRDSFFEQPSYEENTMDYPVGANLFVYDLKANTDYTFYIKLSCNGPSFSSQYWQGPFSLATNGECFVEVKNLFCGQCYVNELGPHEDENIPFHNVGRNDLFPGNNPDNCQNLNYDPQLEQIYSYHALEDGTISFSRGQKKTCSGSKFLVQYYYKSANLPCDLNDWNYLGCWTHEGNDIFDDISFDVQKDSSYYIMFDYGGQLCAGAWQGPSTWVNVTGSNCQNPCTPVENLTATETGDGYLNIEWDETVGALGYDVVLSSAHAGLSSLLQCSSDASINVAAIHPSTSIRYNVDSLLASILPTTSLSIYVRSRCAIDNYSTWREVSVTPLVAFSSEYNNGNTLNYCSPMYDRTTLSPANDIPYDLLEFTVDKSGTFYFSAGSWNDQGTYAGVYENSFDPSNPEQNLIFETENTELASLKFSIDLTAGIPYIFIATHRVTVPNKKLYVLDVIGPAPLSADKFTYRGTHEGPQGTIPSTSGQYYQSNKVCRDDAGWLHYYYSDPTDPTAEDLILLSIEDYLKDPNPSFIFPDNIAYAGGKFGTSLITNPPADYVSNPDGWWTMNRFWDLDLIPNFQPEIPVGIRFYYTENDLYSLKSSTGNFDLEHEDLNFYKINDTNEVYNIDPSKGHAGVQLAPNCADDGIWEYFNAPYADTILWRFDSIPSGYYAEMKVHSFSGGGGGAGSFAPQIDSDMDGFADAIDCDPNNPLVNPAAQEIPYDGIDNDCNPNTFDDDFDMDGYGVAEDCDDGNANISPGLPEIPYDGLDNDCDPNTWDDDVDMDGFLVADDCDDANANVNPNMEEVVYDGLDNDCDPETLDDDLDRDGFNLAEDCDDENANVNPNMEEVVYDGLDNDCDPETLDDDLDMDGFDLAEDCDDEDASINPDVEELAYDGIDNDCDPLTLDDDLDQDGFDLVDDCDDTNEGINPDAEEIPNNGIDEDCKDGDLMTSLWGFSEHLIKLHPNPTTSLLVIEEKGLSDAAIVLFDAMGKILLERNLSKKIEIDMRNFANGVYFVRVKAEEGEMVQKVVKVSE